MMLQYIIEMANIPDKIPRAKARDRYVSGYYDRRQPLVLEAEKTWKRITGHHLIGRVIEGTSIVNGEIPEKAE